MMKTLLEHRTIRKYKSDPIAEDLLFKIIEAGCRASTTGNMQLYSIIISKEKEMREKLCKLHFNQKMVEEAPVVFTICADFNRFNLWCKQRKAEPCYDNFLSFFTAAIDALLVAQNIAIAAEDNGLGICYLGTTIYNAPEIIELLNCPINVVPITTLVIGYPDENPVQADRLPIASIIHTEKYKNYTESDIDNAYKAKEALPQTQELLKINELETLAQIFTQKRYTKRDNEFFSEKFLQAIKKQGFM